jgi:hypothetical protein
VGSGAATVWAVRPDFELGAELWVDPRAPPRCVLASAGGREATAGVAVTSFASGTAGGIGAVSRAGVGTAGAATGAGSGGDDGGTDGGAAAAGGAEGPASGEGAGGAAGAGGGLGALRGGSRLSGSTYVSSAPTRTPRWT